MEHGAILQTLSLAVFLGILAQIIARKFKLPSLIFLMLFGIISGPALLHLLQTDHFEEITTALISVGVAIIIFEGGMTLHLPDLKFLPKSTLNIIFIGPFITMVVVAIILHLILSLDWGIAFLTGSILSVSGPTVVSSLLAKGNIEKKLKEILHWESILVESFGGVLMVVVLHFIISESDSHSQYITIFHFFERLLIGVIAGLLTGKCLLYLIPRKIIEHELLNLSILGILLLSFWGSNALASEAGLLTVAVAGVMVGQLRHPVLEDIKVFKEQLSTLIISVIFILLSAQINLKDINHFGWRIIPAILAILFVARPLMIFLTSIGSELKLREKLFLVWTAPRGVIAAATASLFSVILEEHHYPQAHVVEIIVFLMIISTVIIQGFSIVPVAKLLKVTALPRNGFLLVGIHPFSIAIAKLLQRENLTVKLVDNNNKNIELAKKAGVDATQCNIMDKEELESIGLERIGTMLALTENDETNTLVCRIGRSIIGKENAYQVVNTFLSNITDDVLLNFGGLLAFDMKISVDTINKRLDSGRLNLETLTLEKKKDGYKLPDNFLSSLFFIRDKDVIVAQEDDKIQTDQIIALTLV